ncbi:MAG: VWA domain-containing protein [Myxococcota bacterium]
MKRWHLTFGLSSVAVGAAFLAPRLVGWVAPPDPSEPAPPPPQIAEVVDVVTPVASSTGPLVVDLGYDRSAALRSEVSERYLTVTVTAPQELGVEVRRPVDLAVVMDTSGSMSATGKIDQARRAAKALANQMGPDDTYSLTVFNDDAMLVVPATQVRDPASIGLAIDRIYEGGGTNLYAGMERGANEVRRHQRPGAASRVVVLSDGKANVGVTDDQALVRFAADLAGDGIALTAVGLGLDYNEDLLARLSDVGGGSYHFVDDATSLTTVFEQELARTASVVATGTLVHVELPPGVSPVEVVGWDARAVGNGWDVFLGDVYAGETKKIVTRVRIDGAAAARVSAEPVATAAAVYRTVADGAEATSADTAPLTLTADPRAVAASLDRERSIDATRAVGGKYLDLSTRAYEKGDRGESARLAEEGAALLRRGSTDFADQSLAGDAAELDSAKTLFQSYAPTAAPAREAIKENKELFRDRAR